MKKFFSTITTLVALLAGSSLSVAPAYAVTFPSTGNVYYTVGDVVNLDLGCQAEGTIAVNFRAGNLPAGLTKSNQGLVTGTPTTVGDFTISNYSCTYNWGSSSSSWVYWSLTFHIAPMTTPEPFLGVHNLNTENCSFYVGYLFPETPDSEIASLVISNQAGTSANLMLWSQSANQLYENTYSLSELNDVGNNNLDGSLTVGFAPFTCGDTIAVTLSYKWRGAPAANKTVSDVVVATPTVTPTAGGYPSQRLVNLNNAECQFRILANIPSPASAGTARLTINSTAPGTDQIAFLISDSLASGLIDFTFSPEELAAGEVTREGLVNSINQISTQWSCGMTLFVSVEYRDLLNNFRSSIGAPELQTDGFGITPTKPTAPPAPDTYSITAYPSKTLMCAITVVAKAPDASRPLTLAITSTTSDEPLALLYFTGGISQDGTINATLSMDSLEGFYSSIPYDDVELAPGASCSGEFRAVILLGESIVASDTTTLVAPPVVCGAGWTLKLDRSGCDEAPRGFYTESTNSRNLISCPAGMTTSTTTSKSVNDCYKPIAQTIASFKAPKALKFKGTTNLAITTNSKSLATYKVTGPCTAKVADVVTTVKGKKVTTKMLKVTAGKKAGTCLVDLTAPTSGKYLDLKKVVQMKVSKTGK